MTPYYEDADGITIYHGDCREILPQLGPVDLVVTSPPYNTLPSAHKPSGLHADRKTGINKWITKAAEGYFDTRNENDYQVWVRDVVAACLDRCVGLVWVNHKVRYRDGVAVHPVRFLPFPIYAEVIWNRSGSMALNCKRYAPSHEVILGFGRPKQWNDDLNGLLSVWGIAPQLSEEHPCPFPAIIPERLIRSGTIEGDTVLEPFCGSGTTLVVAKRLGRRAIGIEIEEKYCEIAAERLRREEKPLFAAIKNEQFTLGGLDGNQP